MEQLPSGVGVTVENWPIVVLTSGNLTEGQWAAVFDQYEKAFERREKFVTLSDTSGITRMPSATLRRLVAVRAEKIRPLVVRYSLGDTRIVTSTVARGAMTAINWLYSHPAPVKWVADWSSGVEWCLGQLDAAGVEVPHRVRDLASDHWRPAEKLGP